MKINIHVPKTQHTPDTVLEVEAYVTNHPELAIHKLNVRNWVNCDVKDQAPAFGEVLGQVWSVTHIPSGEIVIYGLLTEDLAKATVDMLTASGIKFGPGFTKPYLLDSYQAAASLMADTYFEQFFKNERGRLAVA
jgi:hypothetical protein